MSGEPIRGGLILQFKVSRELEDVLFDYIKTSIDVLNKEAPEPAKAVEVTRLRPRDFAGATPPSQMYR